MLERLHYLAKEGIDFAFETTLAGRTFAHWIAGLRQTNYDCQLVFLWLPNPEFAIARVRERVRMGGHDVPEDVIRRRYKSGLGNFFQLYQPFTESWHFYANSTAGSPDIIASGSKRGGIDIEKQEIWAQIQEVYSGGRKA